MSGIELASEIRDHLRRKALDELDSCTDTLRHASFEMYRDATASQDIFDAEVARMETAVRAYRDIRGDGPYARETVALLASAYVERPDGLPLEDWGVPSTIDEVDELAGKLASFREMIELRDGALA